MFILSTLLILVSVSCSLYDRFRTPFQVCTLIGCQDSLIVDLKGNIPQDFTLEASSPEGGTRRVRCVDGHNQERFQDLQETHILCLGDSLIMYDDLPAQVTVTFTWPSGHLIQTITPEYSTFQPNGPDCPPDCRVAHIEILFP